jgi:hypothetical protein
MLRTLALLGALTVASCHLAIGLDDFEKGEAASATGSTSSDSSTASAGGTTGSGGGGGAGGDGGSGTASPARWATLFGDQAATETSRVTPMLALDGENALLAGRVKASNNNLLDQAFLASLTEVTVARLLGANGSAPMAEMPTSLKPASDKMADFAVASSPGSLWFAAVTPPEQNGSPKLTVYRVLPATKLETVLSVAIDSPTEVDAIALAVTSAGPNKAGSLYLAFTERSSTKHTSTLHRYTFDGEGTVATPPAAKLVIDGNGTVATDTVVALAASSKAAYLATLCRLSSAPGATNACLYGMPSNSNNSVTFSEMSSSSDKGFVRQRLGCTEAIDSYPLALTVVGDAPYLALGAGCKTVYRSPESMMSKAVFDNYVDKARSHSFGLLRFAPPSDADGLGSSLDSVTSSTPFSQAPETPIVLTSISSGGNARLIVAGTVDKFVHNTTVTALMKIDPKTPTASTPLASAKNSVTAPQAFVLSLAPSLATMDAKASVTSSMSEVVVRSVAASSDTVLLGGLLHGTLELGTQPLTLQGTSAGAPFVTALDATRLDLALD